MLLHNFRHRRMQSGIIFVIVTLAVTLLNGSVCILKSLDEPMKQFAKECHSAQILAYPYVKDEEARKTCVGNLERLPFLILFDFIGNFSSSGF